MLSSGVSKSFFFGEVVVSICYLVNLTPPPTLNGDIMNEQWH